MSLASSIIGDGVYHVVSAYSGKETLVDLVRNELRAVVRGLGVECDSDLTKLHKTVSPDLIPEMQERLEESLKPHMLRLTRDFGREKLGLSDFYLDLKVIARIKYPFAVARRSTVSYLDYSKSKGRTSFAKPPELTIGYHHRLPFPAWAHGPHSDSWFGHSYDGINLWWGIDGVTSGTGMTFYPDYVGADDLPVVDEPPYLVRFHGLPKPVFFDLDPGDVIAFNSDTLHGTRVNESDLTRISLSTRINPRRPRFNLNQFRHVKYWVKAADVDAMLERAVPTGEQSHRIGESGFDPKVNPFIYVAEKKDEGSEEGVFGNTCKKSAHLPPLRKFNFREVAVAELTEAIAENEQILVSTPKLKIVVARIKGQLHALAAICPHVGYSLAGAGHDDEAIYCPGHGLAFRWADGTTARGQFKVKTYPVTEEAGVIRVRLS